MAKFKRLGILPAAVLVCSVLTSACANDSCIDREVVGYPAMEKAAETALRGVEFELARVGRCEDTGRPWSVLQATVTSWTGRQEANRHFLALGWPREDRRFTSPDGAYRVTTMTAVDHALANGPFVVVSFAEIADESEWTASGDD